MDCSDEAWDLTDEEMDEVFTEINRGDREMPIYLVCSNGVTSAELNTVESALRSLLDIVGVDLEIKNFGNWNQGTGDYESVDWYLNQAKTDNRSGYGRQVDSSVLLDTIHGEPWREVQRHYDVMVVVDDLVRSGLNFVIGTAGPTATVFSTRRLRDRESVASAYRYVLDRKPSTIELTSMIKECIKTETLHEVGHVFNAAVGRVGIDALTGETFDNPSLGYNHCANECVMRQGNHVPHAWIKISKDRMESGKPFCDECVEDMRRYFDGH